MNTATTSLGLCLVGGVLLIGFVFVAQAIRIVAEYQRLVVFRLGRCIGQKGPGIVFLIPVVDRVTSQGETEERPHLQYPGSRRDNCHQCEQNACHQEQIRNIGIKQEVHSASNSLYNNKSLIYLRYNAVKVV